MDTDVHIDAWTGITDGDGRFCIIAALSRRLKPGKIYRATVAKWDTPGGWARIFQGTERFGSTSPFTFSMLGMKDQHLADWPVKASYGTVYVSDVKAILGNILMRASSLEAFKEGNAAKETYFDAFRRGGKAVPVEGLKDLRWHAAVRKRTWKRKIIY